MSRRIPLLDLLRAGVVYQYHRGADELGVLTRGLNLKTSKPTVFHHMRPSFIYGDKKTAEVIIKGHFQFSGQILDVGSQGEPWTVEVPSVDFATWLHGFHWLADLAVSKDKNAAICARHLVDKWIVVYGKWNSFSWAPDVLTHRLYNWLSLWSPLLTGDNLSEAAQLRRNSVMRQLKRLRKTYRRTTPGLPRLKAAAVLAMGGARLKAKSDEFLARGLDWLDDEIEKQILPDGGHVSRSPEQTAEALSILLTLDSLLQSRGVEGSRAMSRAIDRLAPVIPFFTGADGKLSSFNGGGEASSAWLKAIKKAGPKTASKTFGYCPHTGFQRIEAEGTVLIVDTGATTPRPFDAQAHLAPLAFELSTELGRLVVNCGWNDQQPKRFRRAVRATAAHSTLTLGNRSSGRLLKEGWASKRLGKVVAVAAGPVNAIRKEQVSGTWLETMHEGYREDLGLSHRRRLYMTVEGDDVRGEDSLFVPLGAVPLSSDEKPFQIRFHFHPDVRVSLSQDQKSALLVHKGKAGWRFRTDRGPLTLEDSVYLGAGQKPVKCQQIVISGHAFCDSDGETRSNRVRWSFRKLEVRK